MAEDPTFELRSSRKDKYALHGLKRVRWSTVNLWSIQEVGARDTVC